MKKATMPLFLSRLGHDFANADLLARALRHASLDVDEDNETLEFLGDRVLGLVIAQYLFETYPSEPEGSLSRRLGQLVSRRICAAIAADIGLAGVLQTDQSRDRQAKQHKMTQNILADGVEALLGAVYLDGGLGAAQAVIYRLWQPYFAGQVDVPVDSKTALQEYLMKRGEALPHYEITDRIGPAHAPEFTVTVMAGKISMSANGHSRRQAEQNAAAQCLAALTREAATADAEKTEKAKP